MTKFIYILQILAFLCLSTSSTLLATKPLSKNIKFTNIGRTEGLPSNTIMKVVKDKFGFVWVATNDGLCRFESEDNIEVFVAHDPKYPNGLKSNNINTLHVDEENNIWIGTRHGGLTRYNQKENTWKTWMHIESDSTSISNNEILCITESQDGYIWIGTEMGLNLFDKETETFVQFLPDKSNKDALQVPSILSVTVDKNNWVWVGTWEGGLYLMTKDTDEDIRYSKFRSIKLPDEASSKHVWEIFQDKKERYWVGTHRGGLYLMDLPYNANNKTFAQDWEPKAWLYKNDLSDDQTLSHNTITDVIEDKSGRIWLATGHGLSVIEQENIPTRAQIRHSDQRPELKLKRFNNDPNNSNSIASDFILRVFEDEEGIVWISTYNGICKYSWFINQIDQYEIFDQEAFSPNTQNIYVDTTGLAWIAGQERGLIQFRPDSDEPQKYFPLNVDKVYSLYSPDDINLYIASSTGIHVYNLLTKSMHNFPAPEWLELSFDNIEISNMFYDSRNRLWLGSESGLFILDETTGEYNLYTYDPADETSILGNAVNQTYQDSRGNIWIGTYNGLNKLNYAEIENIDSLKFERFSNEGNEGDIPSTRVLSMIEIDEILYLGTTSGLICYDLKRKEFNDLRQQGKKYFIFAMLSTEDGNIWGTTPEGIFYFDTKEKNFNIFEKEDGINELNFRFRSAFKDHDGYFNFVNRLGLVRFNPNDIKLNETVTPVYITGIRSLSPKGETQYYTMNNPEVEIGYDHYSITMSFVTVNYNRPEKNKYAYILEGFDEDWIQAKNNAPVVYTNLDPGTYTFRVKASNNDGVWNEEGQSIEIKVNPAIWETWWFRMFGLLLIGLAIYGYTARYTKRVKNRNKELKAYNHTLNNEISERKKFEAALQESKQFLDLVVNNLPNHLYWVDEDFRFLGANTSFADTLGIRSIDTILGKKIDEILTSEKYVKNHFLMVREVFRTGKSFYKKEVKVQTRKGNSIWVEQSFIPISDNNKKIIGVIITADNITNRKKANDLIENHSKQLETEVKERTLELEYKNDEIKILLDKLRVRNDELEKIVDKRTLRLKEANDELTRSNTELEQFAYIASHDMQEPLRIIGNFIGLLSRKYDDTLDDNAKTYIKFALGGVDRMTALIKSLLTYSRVGGKEGEFKDVNLNNLLDEKLLDLAKLIEDKNVDIQKNDLPTIYCESSQISIVFYNLINNAIKFNTSNNPLVFIDAHDDVVNEQWKFSVTDNGIGIEDKFKTKIFEIFKRLHNKQDYEGTGIGLALCQKIIIRHGGKIWVESTHGEGTTFHFTIPKNLKELNLSGKANKPVALIEN